MGAVPHSDRQHYADGGALASLGADLYFPLMRFYHPADDRQPQPGAAPFRGAQERSKSALALFFAHPLAGVAEFDEDSRRFAAESPLVHGAGADRQPSAVG